MLALLEHGQFIHVIYCKRSLSLSGVSGGRGEEGESNKGFVVVGVEWSV